MTARTYPPLEERLWSRADRSGGPDACWPWLGYRMARGYGRVGANGKRAQSTHRVVWEALNGPIPAGLCVLHSCDNPPCVNPAHLWLGSFADNNRDRAAKGRSNRDMSMRRPTRGEMVNTARLTAAHVRTIRLRYAAGGITQLGLAEAYGVHEPAIYKIISRRTWAHV